MNSFNPKLFEGHMNDTYLFHVMSEIIDSVIGGNENRDIVYRMHQIFFKAWCFDQINKLIDLYSKYNM